MRALSLNFLAIVTIISLLSFGLSVRANAEAESFNQEKTQAIHSIIKDYLLKNPEVIRDSLLELERRKIAAQREQQKTLIADNKDAIYKTNPGFVIGNPKGDITIVEFFDYNCPYCRQTLKDLMELMEEDKNIRFVFKEYPILGPGSLSKHHKRPLQRSNKINISNFTPHC